MLNKRKRNPCLLILLNMVRFQKPSTLIAIQIRLNNEHPRQLSWEKFHDPLLMALIHQTQQILPVSVIFHFHG